ncbi:MAG: hypothetical protein UU77_C0032G0001, partial [candidate division WWE3 bacterium GW2011_GWC1_41_7]
YKTVENLQKILISVGVPSVFILSIILARQEHWAALTSGIFGKGDGYFLLPVGLPIASFLAALAYAGAGGNLNLAQSYYVKEKGYGMGKYAGRITSLLTGKVESMSLSGSKFEPTPANVAVFRQWWKNVNIEHFLVFWLTGSITILLLALLAYVTTFGTGQTTGDINFMLAEADQISSRLFPFAGTFFLLVAGLTLFGTQLTVFDATSRILSENLILAFPSRLTEQKLPKIYYIVLWVQILFGVGIFLSGFTQPLQLLTTAAVLNAFAMFVHVGLTLWMNKTMLDTAVRPSRFRTVAMLSAFLFYGGFSLYVLLDIFMK